MNTHQASTNGALYAHSSAANGSSTNGAVSEFTMSTYSGKVPSGSRSSLDRVASPNAHSRYPPAPTTPRSGDEDAEIGGVCGFFFRLPPKVRLWLSFGAWIATTVAVFLAIAFWKTEVFTGLDNLSSWLIKEEFTGYLIMFSLIVLTTVPPFPLYSTLMMLAGYTWGTWPGFVISYTSSLFGAIFVYYISRRFFGPSLTAVIKHMPTFARTVRAISRNPKLLFLVRLAPYPYNMMNVFLAACPGLRWRTYVGCTALSLLKVVIHTSIGSGIHSFKGYYGAEGSHETGTGEHVDTPSEARSRSIAKWSTIIGVVLCVLILLYLGHVARKAVDVELEDEEGDGSSNMVLPLHNRRHSGHERAAESNSDERAAFLVQGEDEDEDGVPMSEVHATDRPGIDRR
ncbi:hypothetical protein M408DRAFT_326282 [Serendipita vermifera MAFF 305830]|uniref:Golgi apparatus membrane protein TVP38 n=1 Tax=Serendipita vermifera MAFF 305830 TaxID=933852 RepID=A0A0C2X6C8_SERVB|nr:hypothetical protein M408DRAFT_326282 [Serendipita vermifera MAFF 305830]